MDDAAGPAVDYFDGRSARPQRVRLRLDGDAVQLLSEDAPPRPVRRLPLAALQWPERTRHGARVAHIDDAEGGGELHALDAAAWDRFAQAAGRRDSWVVRSQQSWRRTLLALALLAVVVVAGWRWGVPMAAEGAVALLPASVEADLGRSAFAEIEQRWFKPSALPAARQQALREAFERMRERAEPGAASAPYRIEFRSSRIGANALALPGGTIVMTDELVTLVEGDDDAVLGVLAHEYGHVKRRHGLRQLVQAGLLGAAAGLAFGDYSSVLAGLPALLGTLGYSRDFEREADGDAIAFLRADGRDPEAMVRFFEALARQRERGGAADALGIAFSSHPADAERIARFRRGH